MFFLLIATLSLTFAEPIPGKNKKRLITQQQFTPLGFTSGNNHPYHTPYYKRQGIEKFIEEDERIRDHCKELLESGAEVETLVS